MKRGRKVLLAAASFLAAAAAAAVILATVEISSPRLEAALTDRAGEVLGVPISTGGVSLRLARGLTARDISLGVAGEEFFTAEKIIMKANLLHLARRKIEIESFIIDKPVITLGADGFFIPPLLPAEAEDPATGVEFSLKSAEIRSGRVASIKNGKPAAIAENIFIRAYSDGPASPVALNAEADIFGAVRLEAAGTIASIRDPDVNIVSSLEVDWAGTRALHASAGGRGKSVFKVSVSGRPEKLEIIAGGEMTEEEISFGAAFLKPAGAGTRISASALLSHPLLQIKKAEIELGGSALTLEGSADFKEPEAELKISGEFNIEDIAECVPALKNAEAAGSGRINALIEKPQGSPLRAAGSCEILDWRISAAGGESLNFEFSLLEETLHITNLKGSIGGGFLTGYGLLSGDGEYEFTVEGIDIDIETLLKHGKNGNLGLGVSGSAEVTANVKSSGKGIENLSGQGVFQAGEGSIQALPAAEKFLAAANLKWILPLGYERIRGEFLMKNGVVTAEAYLRSEKINFATDKAEFDLVNMRKEVHADLLIPPASIEILRKSLGDIQKLLYVDSKGYAHAGLVWDGGLGEAAPNIAASLMRTGQKRIRQMMGL